MSKTTTNFGFIKPELSDVADITIPNANWDKLDEELLKAQEIFVAEFDVTTFKEVNDAFKSGKIVFCIKDDRLLPMTQCLVDNAYRFTASDDGVEYFATVTDLLDYWLSDEKTPYLYGTDDLTAGESKLETGKLYFVYE